MRFFQLTSKTRLVAGDAGECEEAILEVTRQKGTVLQVLDRLSLGVQQPLYSLDDFIAMGQEQLEKFDMRLKRHLARTRCAWPLFRRQERMKSQASKQFSHCIRCLRGTVVSSAASWDGCGPKKLLKWLSEMCPFDVYLTANEMVDGSWRPTLAVLEETLAKTRLLFLGAVALAVLSADPVSAQSALSLSDGRTLAQPPVTPSGDPIRITVRPPVSSKDRCVTERPEAGDLVVKYRFTTQLEQPDVLSVDDKSATLDVSAKEFQITGESSRFRFLIFNLSGRVQQHAMNSPAFEHAVKLRSDTEAMAPLQKAVTDAQTESDQAKEMISATQQQISSLTENMKAFAGMASEVGAQRVATIQNSLEALRTRLTTEQAASKLADTRVAKATEDLRKAADQNNGLPDQLKARADRLSDYIAAKDAAERDHKPYIEAVVLKIGGLLVGRNVKGVYFDLSDRSATSKVTAVSPMGPYPVWDSMATNSSRDC